ncbi:MAG TPA: hypothetical protein PKD37_06225 [Oligoflexia bacterium]|nr:hypothetical protein [Oligoflexia bacterium]HMP27558.1 hypothetical protein [Oligoflexia bacterium]
MRGFFSVFLLLGACAPMAGVNYKDILRSRDLNRRAAHFFDLGDLAEAEWRYATAYRLYKNPDSLGGLGAIYARLNEYDLSKEYFMKLIKTYPDYQRGYLGLGYLALLTEDLETARQYYARAHQIDPGDEKTRATLMFLENEIVRPSAASQNENFSELNLDGSQKSSSLPKNFNSGEADLRLLRVIDQK